MSEPIKKICKVHGELSTEHIAIKFLNYGESKRRSLECRLCQRASNKIYHEKNKEKRYAKQLEWTRKNRDKLRANYRKTRMKNRENQNRVRREKYKIYSKSLDDIYVKSILHQTMGINYKDVTQEMVEIKRCLLLMKRKMKQKSERTKK